MTEGNEQTVDKEESPELVTGSIVEGTVSGIMSFGAFVKLPGKVEGLIHISEIANEYVTNLENYVTMGQTIKVKILGLNKKNKYDLSLKQTEEKPRMATPEPSSFVGGPPPNKMAGRYRKAEKEYLNPFEERMMDFLKKSDEKQIDLKRNLQLKQGIKKRKKK